MLRGLILANRSYRRFDESFAIDRQTLRELVDLARLSASSSNAQPLKFFLACTPEMNGKIFPCLKWAGYLKDWGGPRPGERPSAYIVILGDLNIKQNFGIDPGIAAQSILLGASEKGLGGCMIASCSPKTLKGILNLADHLEILLVLALGKPIEKVVIEPVGESGSVIYYRDSEQTHHVPKRSLDDLIVN